MKIPGRGTPRALPRGVPHGRSRDNAKHGERSEFIKANEVLPILIILRPPSNVAVAYGRLWQREIAVCESAGSPEVRVYSIPEPEAKCDLSKSESASGGAGVLPSAFFTKLYSF